MSLLTVQHVFKNFKGLKVLSDVNLTIEQGECHAIIGPNGAGKSTLFNVISGYYRPTRGNITFEGQDITGRPPFKIARRGLSRSFQIINNFPAMTVYENIRSAVLSREQLRLNMLFRLKRDHGIRRQTFAIMDELGLRKLADVLAGELSYGQQRALEIGLALALQPKLILLDEPTAGMSKEDTREAVGLIKDTTRGKTVVMVEHDMDVVFSIADRISVLYYGQIIATGTPLEIRENGQVQKAYLGKKAHA